MAIYEMDCPQAPLPLRLSAPSPDHQLTPRQSEILKLLARGFYYREIGAELGISSSTVRAHLHAAYRKLEVNNRTRAVLKFHQMIQTAA